jgi:S-DNA-T family DNA segregation ATPase FtsK/SpoIIIE
MSSSHTSHNTDHTGHTSHKAEIFGIFIFLLGLLLGISLLTYNAADPSLSTATTNPTVQNAIGKGGAILSDLLFQIMGISAYFVPVVLVLFGIQCIKKESMALPVRLLFGWSVVMIVISAWAEFLSVEETPINFRGGAISFSLNRFLTDYFGLLGTYLLLSFSLLIGLMTVIPFSPSGIVRGVWNAVAGVWHRILSRISEALEKNHHEPEHHHHQEEEEEAHDEVMAEPEEHAPPRFEPVQYQEADPVDSPANGPANGLVDTSYQLPPLSLLSDPPVYTNKATSEEWAAQVKILKRKLLDFGIAGEVKEIHPGPVVTLFEFEMAPGIKLSRIISLADDLALAMRALQVRIVPRIPGKAVVGIEIPNRVREVVFLKEILASSSFSKLASKTRIALGKDISGVPVAAELAEMPHLLVAGSTGSGKSVGLNTIILSILFSAKPNEVRLLLIDPKMLELSLYEDIPHLFAPVITRPKAASVALQKMVEEMQRRYELMAEAGVRNIEAYNKAALAAANGPQPVSRPLGAAGVTTSSDTTHANGSTSMDEEADLASPLHMPMTPLPYIIVFIDELADLMMVASNDIEESIGRLAQMARAAGIHLVLATQRPSVDVLTGVIKANFTARIAYAVTSKTDSRTILDANGAEQLLGKGDMLCLSAGTSQLLRIHGAYVSGEEVERVVAFIKKQGQPVYEQIFSEPPASQKESTLDARDDLFDKACELIISTGQASASFIQRRLRVGYPRAARMIELMEEDGIVGPAIGSKPREVLARRGPEHGG